jgi:tRNA (guanine-N7-)-methyltransferase
MSQHGRHLRPFTDRAPEDYPMPDLNPYLRLHREAGPPVITAEQATGFRGRWADAFGADRPLHVEIGSGNGFFLAGMAARHPEQSWLGIEIRFKRVMLCATKIKRTGCENARITRYDAWWLDDLFLPGDLQGLYVNHPDPWAEKARHDKNRLMGPVFAAWASRALAVGARLRLKSDHLVNLDSLEAGIAGLPLRLLARVEDLGANGTPWPADDDVITNYQRKFIQRGEPVHAMWLERVDGEAPPADRRLSGAPPAPPG